MTPSAVAQPPIASEAIEPASPRTPETGTAPVGEPDVSAMRRRADFNRQFIASIAWTGAAKWGTQILTWTTTIFVARLLSPADYGLVGMAGVLLGVTALAAEFGVGAAVVRMRDLGRRELSQLNTISIALGALGVLVGIIAAIPMGAFFKSAALPAVVVALSMAFIVDAFRVVPTSLLARDLRFRELAIMESVRATLTAVVTLALAFGGFAYWSLVIGSLVGSAAATLAVLVWYPHPFALPRIAAVSTALTYSRRVFTGRIAWYGYSNADFLVAGRLFGTAALGAYTFAWNLASLPVEKITALVTQVTPAFFSAVQDDVVALRRYFLGVSEGLALVSMPVTVGLALVARDFVLVVLGDQWAAAATPLALLAAYACLRSLVTILPHVLNVTGEARFAMRVTVATALVLPIAFVVFGKVWGMAGIGLAWVLVYPLFTLPLYSRTFARLGITAWDYLRRLAPAIQGSAGMAATVLLTHALLIERVPLAFVLAGEVVAGGLTYALILWTWHRARVLSFRDMIRGGFGRSHDLTATRAM